MGIKVIDSEVKNYGCACCSSKFQIKDLLFSYELTNSKVSNLRLCKNCRKDLMDLLVDEFRLLTADKEVV